MNYPINSFLSRTLVVAQVTKPTNLIDPGSNLGGTHLGFFFFVHSSDWNCLEASGQGPNLKFIRMTN